MTIQTKHQFGISTQVEAARQSQRAAFRSTFHVCGNCDRTLSVAEFIERHCEDCNGYTKPVAVKGRS
ncbi:hypothetical protein [Rhizobium sp. BK456]|uniref:hypothetical protein n=1 Tax=Rhizobium sp. BK456 TaxID=2587007 RepID=UPI00161A4A95|nr:hypothetical protein [Rhizobium sp. BK456]MBB3521083.1 putative CHY-type Zn-finger protein [Rhizobium sp. BK456]